MLFWKVSCTVLLMSIQLAGQHCGAAAQGAAACTTSSLYLSECGFTHMSVAPTWKIITRMISVSASLCVTML